MGAGDLELLDLLYDDDSSGDQPRLKVGDQASGAGVGQDCVYLATDGFISQPIAPDGNGACATAVVWTPGNDRVVIACADTRYNGKAGSLSAGDRAIVSNCDACFKLTQAANKAQLLASAQNMELTVDAANQKVVAKVGGLSLTLDGVANTAVLNQGQSEVVLTATALVLNFIGVSATLDNTGLNLTGPPGIAYKVNGTPITVP